MTRRDQKPERAPSDPSADALRLAPFKRPSTAYLVLGVLVGVGAPLGFLALRRLVARRPSWREELAAQRTAYSYIAIATPIAFGVFGRLLGHQQEKLRRSYEHIERLREEFATIVAHDLRNPLTAILLHADTLLQSAHEGSVTVPVHALQRLSRAGRHLDEMIDDLLDMAQIEAARLRLKPEPLDLAEALSALLDRLRPAIGEHAVELAVVGSPPRVLADPARLDQIVTNLVENAGKYSPEGAPIRVEVRPARGGASVAVQDRGWGIPAAEMPHLFDRFFQAKRAREKKSGLGLGLYITKGLVEAHGGSITVNSEVARGSTFTVWLPAAA